MKITITLNAAEVAGIKSYLSEIDGERTPAQITSGEVAAEMEIRLQNALRDPREAISSHIDQVEGNSADDYNDQLELRHNEMITDLETERNERYSEGR
jgi:hypothetical protein